MTREFTLVLMCFAVPFAITAGIAIPILIGDWLSKRMNR